ncbi:homoserine kinase [Sulfodiicoccus acidiphilus]|uniref:Homoserine kinase n=2 Tax=Sulfodiicoccus acidiphilus TaxID=1670455 RepID=A0A348B417_9CREN|nr:homoserine kinase [Sulfodiicoccus acidiphilus]GGT88004.1 homoserine kinase [Sulfodiicoccus acidiphilus]
MAHSSSANLGPGFDVLAVAHSVFRDEVEVRILGEGSLKVELAGGDPLTNTASYAVLKMLENLGHKVQVEVRVRKGIPAGLGLGSSGASAAAAVAALNELLGSGVDRNTLVKYAMVGEVASSGSPHPDNVAASVVGGWVAVTSVEPLKVVSIPAPRDYLLVLVVPDLKLEGKTKKAREMVPRQISMEDHVESTRRLTSLLVGLSSGNRELVREGMRDNLVETARLPLFPFYPEVRKSALERNAVGVCVSGAGPSVLILADRSTDVDGIRDDVRRISGLRAEVYLTEVGEGVKVEVRN